VDEINRGHGQRIKSTIGLMGLQPVGSGGLQDAIDIQE
jgi:hypothetical protein